jgi:hypothetical protein
LAYTTSAHAAEGDAGGLYSREAVVEGNLQEDELHGVLYS